MPNSGLTHYTVIFDARQIEPRGDVQRLTHTTLAAYPSIAENNARAYASSRGLLTLRIISTTGRPARPDEMLRAQRAPAGVPGLFDEDH
jgi:hypothetical protein